MRCFGCEQRSGQFQHVDTLLTLVQFTVAVGLCIQVAIDVVRVITQFGNNGNQVHILEATFLCSTGVNTGNSRYGCFHDVAAMDGTIEGIAQLCFQCRSKYCSEAGRCNNFAVLITRGHGIQNSEQLFQRVVVTDRNFRQHSRQTTQPLPARWLTTSAASRGANISRQPSIASRLPSILDTSGRASAPQDRYSATRENLRSCLFRRFTNRSRQPPIAAISANAASSSSCRSYGAIAPSV
ncbi:hypothetical protein SEGD1_022 [Enterobacteria phage SEGD1]|uniref:Uncharacterized protein n=1 Tax=Enterobacteria phage SEGD1 TaxID=1805456 RepID=A0A142II85_9CAUD|nr:hypothetical protein SEGD1_022 [Enterobacteria phage SEGD1]